ncbi:hypothetical protein SASPL_142234 [Salvia splendens]|uniref:Calmodulin-binding domain-containing protein n=1 Tax=Salvia splendens TaxID=180675 RepID=A0A8X8WK90_SALSN|nr:enolase-phosphatase E1-like [Salvia splendens]XP_042024613.1 enolase-phosphatase E1-like [Salvia splendens]XP_042024614.1 enolase-phosphatase E1-like [Salvia splendens]XP_042024615.1 enolase-phosphatase E1-like [Salvia splendens]KAG6396095.1 hypothetical protein SASPL_142234 [Salvia splendens]
MAEASDDSLVTPTKSDGSVNNDLAGNQDSASNGRSTDAHNLGASVGSRGRGNSSLRSSADKLVSSNGNEKVVPHYLRASTGSCHDFCKFGKHHLDESKASKPFRKRIAKLSPDHIPVEIRVAGDKKKKEVVLSGEETREVAAGGKKKDVVAAGGKKKDVGVAGGEKREEVVARGKKKKEAFLSGEKKRGVVTGGEEKREVVAGGKKKEVVATGGKKKEEVVASDKKKEEVVASDKKKEEVVLSGEEKREVVAGDEKKEEVVAGDEKKEEVVAGDEKKEEVVTGDQKKEEVVTGDQKKDEVVASDEMMEEVASDDKMEEVVSGIETMEEFVNHGPPINVKVCSTSLRSSLDTESYTSKPKTSLSKEKETKHGPSTYTNNSSPRVPSSNSKSNLRTPKLSKTSSSKQNGSSGSKTILPKCKSSSAKKSPSVDPPEIFKSVYFPHTEVEDSVKQGSSIDDKISKTRKKTTSAAKQRLSPVKLKPVKVKPSYSPNDSDGMHGKGRSNSNVQPGRKLMTAKASAKKTLTPPPATLLSKLPLKTTAQINSGKRGNLKLASPLKDPNRIRRVNTKASQSEKVTEKKLHVIRVGAGNNVSETSPKSPLSAESSSRGKSLSLSSYEEDNSEMEESSVKTHKLISKNSLKTVKEAPVKENPKKTVRKNRVVVAGDKHISPVKVKFRMGKVVELQSDNNTPRKLIFRRARVLGVEESNLRRKTTKKAGVTSDTAGTGVLPQKVVLKHQDVQGKKDAQGLLNNVIEETASKLVVSRKSKVKALVGAFETVISLQESKPSTQVVS